MEKCDQAVQCRVSKRERIPGPGVKTLPKKCEQGVQCRVSKEREEANWRRGADFTERM